jgi:hypothetical protein
VTAGVALENLTAVTLRQSELLMNSSKSVACSAAVLSTVVTPPVVRVMLRN